MFQFKDKIVYIISPERWGDMKVSKHHYALELAERNCRVFFIEPPKLTYSGIIVKPCSDHKQINIVNYKPIFRAKRYLPSFLYSFLVKLQINRIISAINLKPDIVWSFHGYLFENLKWFGAPVNIFFAADQFFYNELPPEIDSATLSLAISDTIFNRISQSGKKVFRINHGLNELFVKGAEELLIKGVSCLSLRKKPIVAGFTGNLRMQALDQQTIMQVIENNPEVNFIFWGSYRNDELNLGGMQNVETDRFICFLEEQKNVELRGVVNSQQLQEQMKEADLFWLCWNIGVNQLWDGSNSHKILEYLSTGKPVVSHFVSSYADSDLLYMLIQKDNYGYLDLFKKVIDIVMQGETPKIIENRIKAAVENSYKKNLEKIAEFISYV